MTKAGRLCPASQHGREELWVWSLLLVLDQAPQRAVRGQLLGPCLAPTAVRQRTMPHALRCRCCKIMKVLMLCSK